MHRIIFTFLTVICCAAIIGCTRKEAPPAAKAARVSATRTYDTYFGAAPTTDKGTCFAFVIFFPSAKVPGKIVPFPFFSFDQESLKKVAVQRLIGGMDEKSYAGEFLQLFPKGVRLLSLTEKGGMVTANFSGEMAAAAKLGSAPALFNAVSLTLAQFGGVTSVRMQSDGADLFPSEKRLPTEAAVVVQPSAPRLLSIVAMKHGASEPVAEVDALFDRPVNIQEFKFSAVDGSPLAGDVFHSMFDMAAVLKPKEPGNLSEGVKIKVRWKVTDKTGRSGTGEEVLPLAIKVHGD